MQRIGILFILFFPLLSVNAQEVSLFEGSPTFNKKRTIGVSAFNGLGWAGSISGLYFVWYKDFPKSGFHVFDDSHEWMQMDKMGHLTASWHMARISGDLYEWSGINHKNAAIIGTAFSLAYMSTFEFLDATNEAWGFSWSDMGFNSIGALTYGIQEYFWNRQFFKIKFSAHHSGLAEYRPEVLGSDPMSRMLKDYNGQTYWLSINPITLINPDSKVPAWINLSFGYSIEDHLVGDGSTYVVQTSSGQESFTPYRQYYLSLDIDFEEIEVQSRWLKLILRGINVVKIPFPALEFSEKGVSFKPLYF